MSREDPIVIRINRKSVRMVRGTEPKRRCRDADVIINEENAVVKDRFANWPGNRAPTAEETAKAEEVRSE